MILNERGLVRAVKLAWKRAGYTICNNGDAITLYTEDWMVCVDWDKLPRKALSVIVEHMGTIPAPSTAWHVMKGMDPQVVMIEVVGEDMNFWLENEDCHEARAVPIIIWGAQLFQCHDSYCFGSNTDAVGMVEPFVLHTTMAAVMDDRRIQWAAEGERISVRAVRPADNPGYTRQEQEIWKMLESVNLRLNADGE